MKKILFFFLMMCCISQAFANLTQSHWRWRNNNGTETSATWKTAQDSPISVNDKEPFRLRMEIYNGLQETKPFDHNLLYATSVNGPWYVISNATSLQAFVFAADNNFIRDGEPTTKQLTATKGSFSPGSIITGQTTVNNDSLLPGAQSVNMNGILKQLQMRNHLQCIILKQQAEMSKARHLT